MKKLLLSLCIIILILTGLSNTLIQAAPKAAVPKGTMVMVYPAKPISTDGYQENDFVYFINPSDVWQGETNVFPKNSVFKGYVNFLKLPVQGVNGAIGMKINEVVYPNGKKQRIAATIFLSDSAIIGGTLTPPATYVTSIHRTKGWARGALQWVPSGEYEFGKHTTIPTSEALFVVLDENFIPSNY